MARAIIRYSFDNDDGTNGMAVRTILTGHGFANIGTATFEANDPVQGNLIQTLRTAIDRMNAPTGGAALDHLWIYVDRH